MADESGSDKHAGAPRCDALKDELRANGWNPEHSSFAFVLSEYEKLEHELAAMRFRAETAERDRSVLNPTFPKYYGPLLNAMADLSDHPIARMQVGPDGVVPTGTVQALELWKAEADRLHAELAEANTLIRALNASSAERRVFPIQRGPSVPWEVMAPHEDMARRNHDQTLERLAERGGLDAGEAWCVVNGIGLTGMETKQQWAEYDRQWREYAERINLRLSPMSSALPPIPDISELPKEHLTALRAAIEAAPPGDFATPRAPVSHERSSVPKEFAARVRPAVAAWTRKCDRSVLNPTFPKYYGPLLRGEADKAHALLEEIDAMIDAPAPDCSHYWIPNSGKGGEPEFRLNRQMGAEPVMHVMCSLCDSRTWFTEKQWQAIPATVPPIAASATRGSE